MLSVLITATLATTVPFQAHALDGHTVVGELAALSSKELVLQTDSGPVNLPLSTLASLAPRTPRNVSPSGAPLWIELRGGSELPAIGYEVTKGMATVRISADKSRELPTRAVRSVRFGSAIEQDPKLAKQWSDITEMKTAGDLLVIRKEEALDYLEGVVRDINSETCQFDLDGETVAVKLGKIAGIAYSQAGAMELPESIGKLVATDGTRLAMRSVELTDDVLKVATTAGTTYAMPLVDVARFDFSSGKIVYLSDLEPESVTFTPLFGFEKPPQGLLGFYEYRRDTGFEQSPLRLDGQVFRKGLALASRTELVYKLPGNFRLFRTIVGIDDSTRETGSVRLTISGDGKVLWHGEVKGTDPPLPLELEIAGARRLEILADYGEGLDVGDRLDLGDAQVTK